MVITKCQLGNYCTQLRYTLGKQSPVCAGVGSSSTMVQAVRNLPQQQQLLICAATKLLGGHKQEPATSAANQPTTSGLSGLPRKVKPQGSRRAQLPLLSCLVHCYCSLQAMLGMSAAYGCLADRISEDCMAGSLGIWWLLLCLGAGSNIFAEQTCKKYKAGSDACQDGFIVYGCMHTLHNTCVCVPHILCQSMTVTP